MRFLSSFLTLAVLTNLWGVSVCAATANKTIVTLVSDGSTAGEQLLVTEQKAAALSR